MAVVSTSFFRAPLREYRDLLSRRHKIESNRASWRLIASVSYDEVAFYPQFRCLRLAVAPTNDCIYPNGAQRVPTLPFFVASQTPEIGRERRRRSLRQ